MTVNRIASKFCWKRELRIALKRQQEGTCRVIPLIAKPCNSNKTQIGQFQVVPGNSRPVSSNDPRDEGWTEVCFGIEKILDEALSNGSLLEEVLIPFRKISRELRDNIRCGRNIWLCSRSGLGFWRDFGDALDPLFKKNGKSRALWLDPDSSAFETTRHRWRPGPFGSTPPAHVKPFDVYREF